MGEQTNSLTVEHAQARLGFFDVLIHSSLFLALNAFCGSALVGAAMGMPFDATAWLLPFFLVFSYYTFDKVTGLQGSADRVNQPGRHLYFKRYGTLNSGLAALSLALVLYLTFRRSFPLGMLSLFLPVVALSSYSMGWKKLFPDAKYTRIKDVPLAKTLATSVLWSVILVLIPALYLGVPFSWTLLAFHVHVTLRLIVNTVTFDVADIEGDKLDGTRTLAVILGPTNTLRWLAFINLLSLAWIYVMGRFSNMGYISLYVGGLYAFVYLFLWKFVRNKQFFNNIFVDGEFGFTYLVYIGLYLITHSH